MHKIRLFKLFAIVLFITAISSCTNKEKHELGYNLVVGETYVLFQESVSTMIYKIMGSDQEIDFFIGGESHYLVKDKIDDRYIIQFSFEKMKFDMDMMSFDSDEPGDSDDMMNKIFSAVTKMKLDFEMLKTGEIVNIQDMDEMIELMINTAFEEELTDDEKNQIAEAVKSQGTFDGFFGAFESILHIYPEKAVSIGEKWNNSYTLKSTFEAYAENEWSIKSISGNEVVLESTGKLSTAPEGAEMEIEGMTTTFDLTGTQTNHIKTDPVSGWILEADNHIKMDIDAKISMGAGMGGSMNMKMTNDVNNRFKSEPF